MFAPLIKEIRDIDATRTRKLREFGVLLGVVLLLVAVFASKGNSVCSVLSLLFFISAAFAPKVLKLPYRLWMALALIMGFCVSHIILSVLFYVLITPLGALLRTFGKDFLRERSVKHDSYWISSEKEHTLDRYRKMF